MRHDAPFELLALRSVGVHVPASASGGLIGVHVCSVVFSLAWISTDTTVNTNCEQIVTFGFYTILPREHNTRNVRLGCQPPRNPRLRAQPTGTTPRGRLYARHILRNPRSAFRALSVPGRPRRPPPRLRASRPDLSACPGRPRIPRVLRLARLPSGAPGSHVLSHPPCSALQLGQRSIATHPSLRSRDSGARGGTSRTCPYPMASTGCPQHYRSWERTRA